MESWREDALPGHTHDPNEVTVPIDGLGRTLADLPAAFGAGGLGDAGHVGHGSHVGYVSGEADVPASVEETGRRDRKYRRMGVIVGIACVVYALVIVGTLFSGSTQAPWLPVRGPEGGAGGGEGGVEGGKGDGPVPPVDASGRPDGLVEPAVSADPSASSSAAARARDGREDAEAGPEPGEKGGLGASRRGDEDGSPRAALPAEGGEPGPGARRADGGGPGQAPTGGATAPAYGPAVPAAPLPA
ncbi:hypothetical protein GKQ77_31965, partial [Streptomyces sp. BG9H]|nr:hypothetical protein [Streptomyces anatolicus]